MRFTRIGVIAGVPAELDAVLPDHVREPIGDGAIARVPAGERTLLLACRGIGKVAAATLAGELVAGHGVDLLAVVGTAGNLAGLEPGAYRVSEAIQADYGARRAGKLIRYTAGEWPMGPATCEAFRPLALLSALPTARIATSDLFVECGDHAAELQAELQAELVDMETAAVAQSAALLGVPWLAVKAVTDDAGEGSADSFNANLARAAREAAAAFEALLDLS